MVLLLLLPRLHCTGQGPPGAYYFHEVISGAGEPVVPSMYYGIGQVRVLHCYLVLI